jgi:hypothetical protein
VRTRSPIRWPDPPRYGDVVVVVGGVVVVVVVGGAVVGGGGGEVVGAGSLNGAGAMGPPCT